MSDNKIVFPGDEISTTEEMLPGEGTYEEDGIIKASRIGKPKKDKKNRKITISPVTSIPVVLEKGDIVLGEVRMIKSSMVIVDVEHAANRDRNISSDTNGTIHISEISDKYVKDASSEFGRGDIIRAQVIQVAPSLQLSTKGPHLGSIKSLCTNCRSALQPKGGNKLECPNCGNKQSRKTASDYGQGNVNKT